MQKSRFHDINNKAIEISPASQFHLRKPHYSYGFPSLKSLQYSYLKIQWSHRRSFTPSSALKCENDRNGILEIPIVGSKSLPQLN